jgi:hypothetical protein
MFIFHGIVAKADSCEKIFARIAKAERNIETLSNSDEKAKVLRHKFINEIKNIALHENPTVKADINYVFVLSGRGSYLKNAVDNPHINDKEDDYQRMRLGIEIARKITALKASKRKISNDDIIRHGPIIIYNGRPKHNQDLKVALFEKNLITDYPASKFLILDLPHDQLNSKGHFISLAQNVDLNNKHIAIVTSAFHFPRIGRMLSENEPFNYFGKNVTIYAYLYDRAFKAPGILVDIYDEAQKIPTYVAKGDLMEDIYADIIFNGKILDNCKTN